MSAAGIPGIDPMDADTNGLGDDPEEIRHCDGCGDDYNVFEESHVGHEVNELTVERGVRIDLVAMTVNNHRLRAGWFRTRCMCGWAPTREAGGVYRARQHSEHVAELIARLS